MAIATMVAMARSPPRCATLVVAAVASWPSVAPLLVPRSCRPALTGERPTKRERAREQGTEWEREGERGKRRERSSSP
eukprot:4072255-Alexandrium_andersonii.AAC.1